MVYRRRRKPDGTAVQRICVYFADSPENAIKILIVKMQKGQEKELAVIPVNIDDNKVNLSDDHNKDYFERFY